MITLIAAISLAQTPRDALVGVWATASNDAVYVFDNTERGRYLEGDKTCTFHSCGFVPNGDYYGPWSRSKGVGDTASESGTIRFKLDRLDVRGYPSLLRPEYLLNGTQVPIQLKPITLVGGTKIISFQGAYTTDGVTLTIDPPTMKLGNRIYDANFDRNDYTQAVYTITLINRETGRKAGSGSMTWAPTPGLVSQMRRVGEIPTDRILISVSDGTTKRKTFLAK